MKLTSELEIHTALKNLNAYDLLDKSLSKQEITIILKKQFRILAFQYHPDRNLYQKNLNKNLQQKFVVINESYNALKEMLHKNPLQLLQSLPTEISQDEKIYRIYKTACKNFSEALEDYFNKVKIVDLSNHSEAYQQLKPVLETIKEQFATVLKKSPTGIWANDSIEKIQKINVWLKQR